MEPDRIGDKNEVPVGATPETPYRALLVMGPETFSLQFGPEQIAQLRSLATLDEPVVVHELESEASRARLADVSVLLTSWGAPAITPKVLNAAPGLRAVLHCAGSVRHMIDDSVFSRGITVSTAADINAIPVAEYTLAAIIMAGKRVPFLARMPINNWRAGVSRADLSNRGRSIGIVGFSRIGRRVMELLRVLEVGTVRVYDPHADPAAVAERGGQLTSLTDLVRHSEILSLHAPALPETHRMIGARELGMLPDGATVINTARGALLDHQALAQECGTGRLYAVLDVTDPEPLPADHPLKAMDNVLITPHVAGSLGGEARRMSDYAIDELERLRSALPLRGQLHPTTAPVTA